MSWKTVQLLLGAQRLEETGRRAAVVSSTLWDVSGQRTICPQLPILTFPAAVTVGRMQSSCLFCPCAAKLQFLLIVFFFFFLLFPCLSLPFQQDSFPLGQQMWGWITEQFSWKNCQEMKQIIYEIVFCRKKKYISKFWLVFLALEYHPGNYMQLSPASGYSYFLLVCSPDHNFALSRR